VGSGKTVVAALAATLAAQAGYQTTIMAPTEVLANQHFATLRQLFKNITAVNQPTTALVTATTSRVLHETDREEAATKASVQKKILSGKVSIAIGTHALIQKSVGFKNLGLVVVDEQHRFGVKQRAELLRRTSGKLIPHFLSMSATPIPRTLMMTVFGDLDLSTITELPLGRKQIVTRIVPPEKRAAAYEFIRAQVKRGRQAFVICPRIEIPSSDEQIPNKLQKIKQWNALETKSVKEEYEKLAKKVFPTLRVAMLHGQMKAVEKVSIMKDFREGAVDVLVSTSVIEVGVDVPNATVMMIEGSDRFGLAQLYQFRGRVGRGEHQSYCLLFTESSSQSVTQRLKAIIEAKNGFELAERDLQIRGPGEFLGQKQTGLPDVAMSGLQNPELIRSSRTAAVSVMQNDPQLKKNTALAARLAEFEALVHLE
jgi:ATP-dependent DNA helicase RecG